MVSDFVMVFICLGLYFILVINGDFRDTISRWW